MQPTGPITELLSAVAAGDTAAVEPLWDLVYHELHRIARRQVAQEGRPARQPTTLVHEAYLRLIGPNGAADWNSRRHFFVAAANAMRRIRIEDARKRRRLKRGGGRVEGEIQEDALAIEPESDPAELLALDDALTRLAAMNSRQAEVVSLRYFAGLGREEIAEVLGISPRTVDSEWRCARAWLYKELTAET